MATNPTTKPTAISDEIRLRRRAMRKGVRTHGMLFRKVTAHEDEDFGKYVVLSEKTETRVPGIPAMTIPQGEAWLKKYTKEHEKAAPEAPADDDTES